VYSRKSHKGRYNTEHALGILDKEGYRHTLSLYNILILPWQQWLRERASMFYYTYIACIVLF